MNYLLTEEQFNELTRIHEQIQFLADLTEFVGQDKIQIRASGFIGLIHHLDNQMTQALNNLPYVRQISPSTAV